MKVLSPMMSKQSNEANYASAGSTPLVRGLPLIGVARRLHRNPIKFFSDVKHNYGDRVKLRVLGRHVLVLTDPHDVEEVLLHNAEHFAKSAEVQSLRPVFGDGLYSSEGERWRQQRRIIQSTFRHERILQYSSAMVERMMTRSSTWPAGVSVDLFSEMQAFTTDVICEVLFGKDQSASAESVASSVRVIFCDLKAEVLYLSLWQRLPLARSRRWRRALKVLTSSISNLIDQRRSNGLKGESLLDMLLEARDERGDNLSDEYIHDEIVTMFLAGQEVSAVALSWALVLMAQNQESQDEAAAEIARVTDGRELMAQDLPHLLFLHAVVQETLRLYPPLWMLGRTALHNTQIGNLPINKGSAVWICTYQIQRDERWFNKSEAFIPHRWNDPNRGPKFRYFPFGGGQRNCVAQQFATAEVVLGLAVIVSRFRMRLAPNVTVEADAGLTLRPKYGVPVVLEAR